MIQQLGNTKHEVQVWHLKLVALQLIFIENFLAQHGLLINSKPFLNDTVV
jgi:hypothetical protein